MSFATSGLTVVAAEASGSVYVSYDRGMTFEPVSACMTLLACLL